jgi:hypothetical protein
MARKVATATTVANHLAASLREEPAASRLWVRSHDGVVELWLLTQPLDPATEERLYRVGLALYEQFPELNMLFTVLNPDWFEEGDALSALPSGIEEIALRAA